MVLFKCKWVHTTRDRGYQKDILNFNCVNFDKLIYKGEREEHEFLHQSISSTIVVLRG